MLIDETYFVGKLSVPHLQATEGVDSSLSSLADLERYISIYEPKFLKELLGDLYDTYIEDKELPEWVAFENLVRNDTLKLSPIANYVFFYFYPDMVQSNTGTGTIRAAHENSIDMTDSRLVSVWNEMGVLLEDVFEYLYSTFTGLPEWDNFRTINIYGL